jgi:small subunit ribosomal protein S4
MARYTGPVCRLCRRTGEKLFLKGERCYTPKCSVEKRRRPPGNQVARRRRVSDWGIQLREKQKARQVYGVLERQFRTYFGQARKTPGVTGTNLLELLERRLDNVVHRVGFGDSRQQARQWVLHGHFTVNGRKVWTPSFRVHSGDVVGWREQSTKLDFYQDVARRVGQRPLPAWLSLNKSAMTAEVLRTPELEDFDSTIETRLIVEHYSR